MAEGEGRRERGEEKGMEVLAMVEDDFLFYTY